MEQAEHDRLAHPTNLKKHPGDHTSGHQVSSFVFAVNDARGQIAPSGNIAMLV